MIFSRIISSLPGAVMNLPKKGGLLNTGAGRSEKMH
jgi:hypothetical protein